jgi:hypothetical protein
MIVLHTDKYDADVPTTRRYPRTLWEAFPDMRTPSIERPAPRDVTNAGHRLIVAVGIVVACATVALIATGVMQ